MSNENMRIWDAVSKTDPDHTKKVNQRGGFTAIDAHYQIMRATEQFGPIGIGWGYIAGEPIFQDRFVIVPVTVWHGDRSQTFGPVYGCCEMFGNRPDSDAPKKAGTDGLTKLLSQLGFNADVFLKKFDDNKYVQELHREKKASQEPRGKPDFDAPTQEEINTAIGHINVQTDLGSLKIYWDGLAKSLPNVAKNEEVIKAKDELKNSLSSKGGTG